MEDLLKLLSTNELIAQIINFLILLLLLRIFLWKRVLTLLDRRKAKIADDLKKVEDSHAQAVKLQVEYEEKLAEIESEAHKKIQEAIAQGRQITEEMRKKAHEEAQTIINNAKSNIQHELEHAKEELKDKIVDLAISAAETVIEDRLTEEEDRRLVRDFLKRMDEVDDKR
jgi:F-type H+-transporting ATPase subunit b